MKRTSNSTPILIALIASLVCLVGAPRNASSGDTTKGILQGTGIGAFMSAMCLTAVMLSDESDTDEEGYARRGWLVGAGGSYVFETFEHEVESEIQKTIGSTASTSADDSFSVNGRVGYRCHPRFSVELEEEWVHGFEIDLFNSMGSKIATDDVAPWVETFNTKGYLLTGRYQPFVLLGGGIMTADYDAKVRGFSDGSRETNFAMRFGGGVDLYATKHVVVSLETDYVIPFGNVGPLDYLSFGLGLQYRF